MYGLLCPLQGVWGLCVFKRPNILAKGGGVSVIIMTKSVFVVIISILECIFCEADICFFVFSGDCCLVDYPGCKAFFI